MPGGDHLRPGALGTSSHGLLGWAEVGALGLPAVEAVPGQFRVPFELCDHARRAVGRPAAAGWASGYEDWPAGVHARITVRGEADFARALVLEHALDAQILLGERGALHVRGIIPGKTGAFGGAGVKGKEENGGESEHAPILPWNLASRPLGWYSARATRGERQ